MCVNKQQKEPMTFDNAIFQQAVNNDVTGFCLTSTNHAVWIQLVFNLLSAGH